MMKNAKKRFALVLYRKDQADTFKTILNETMVDCRVHMRRGSHTLGHGRDKDGWCIYQFTAVAFSSYRDFDNFLFILSIELSKTGVGVVLGHCDDEGFFWMDYPSAADDPYGTMDSSLTERLKP